MPVVRVRRGYKQRFNVSGTHRNRQLDYFGERVGLFRASMNVNTDKLDKLTVEMEMSLAREILKLAVEAREIARNLAPVKSGALKAGIYVTKPASKEELNSFRGGGNVPRAKMLGHSMDYYEAITAAANKRGEYVPGSEEDAGSGIEDFISPRTQRLKKNLTKESLSEHLGNFGDEGEAALYGLINGALPFNPMGMTTRDAFFVGLGSAAYYSAWVEYGTSKQRSQAFFTPAADWMVAQAPRRMAEAMRKLK